MVEVFLVFFVNQLSPRSAKPYTRPLRLGRRTSFSNPHDVVAHRCQFGIAENRVRTIEPTSSVITMATAFGVAPLPFAYQTGTRRTGGPIVAEIYCGPRLSFRTIPSLMLPLFRRITFSMPNWIHTQVSL